MIALSKENRNRLLIPDNSDAGLTDVITISQNGHLEEVQVSVNVSHPFVGDLSVALVAPSGKTIDLHKRGGGSSNDLVKTYEMDVLGDLAGEKTKGNWKLVCKDHAVRDSGYLNSWAIDLKFKENIGNSEVFVPDNSENGLVSVQDCKFSGRVTDLKLHVDIEHPFSGDLVVKLAAPSGKTVTVHNRGGGSTDNLKKTYGADVLADMMGESTKGNWTLTVNDHAPKDNGKLRHWKLDMRFSAVDDLKKIEGIGPKVNELLNNAGIFSYSQVMTTSMSALQTIIDGGGDNFKLVDVSTWHEQADMCKQGRFAEVKEKF